MRKAWKTLLVVTGIVGAGVLASAADPPPWAFRVLPPDTPAASRRRKAADGAGQHAPVYADADRQFLRAARLASEITRRCRASSARAGRRKDTRAGTATCQTGSANRRTHGWLGLPVGYFKQQVEDFKSGARKSAIADIAAARVHDESAGGVQRRGNRRAAARYFATLPQPPAEPDQCGRNGTVADQRRSPDAILVPDGTKTDGAARAADRRNSRRLFTHGVARHQRRLHRVRADRECQERRGARQLRAAAGRRFSATSATDPT